MLNQTKPNQIKLLRLTPLAAALLACFSALAPQASIAAPSEQNSLPDLGNPTQQNSASIRPGPNGLTIENSFDRKKLILTPEYSNQTGASIGATLAAMLGDNAAIGVLLTAGADKTELLLNAGFKFDERQSFIVTVGQLDQFLDYAFLSGTEKVGVTQISGALGYQLQMGQEFLRFLEVNGYVAKTTSRELANKTFTVDTATVYELWSEPRRIAGGTVTGLQARLGFSPINGSVVKVSLGSERLSYDLLSGADNVNRFTGGMEWLQQLGSGYQFKVAADAFSSQNRYTLGVERSLGGSDGRHNLGVSLVALRGRDGLGDDSQIKLTYTYVFGARGVSSAPQNPTVAQAPRANATPVQASSSSGIGLLNLVAMRPGFIPSHVVAKVDNSVRPARLIAVDKTALPTGASVDTATGDVSAPLGLAVTGIAGVTKNLVAFANVGQFSLSGNSLVIKPSLIVQPAVGVIDTYVVTVNNLGGGTSLITVQVSHGSVKIDRITIVSGDTTAPLTTAAPAISGTTDTGTTLSATINETGTGYYLVQAAAAVAPTVAAVQAGTSFAMTANVAATPAISGLTASTAYKIYFVAKDAANNVQAAVQSVAVTTTAAADITPPITTAAPAISVAAMDTTASVTQTINENGTGYYLVLPAASAAPTVAAVKAGTSFAMTGGVVATVSLTGLAASTPYKYYFVAKDSANNDQTVVSTGLAITTLATDAPSSVTIPTGTATDTTITITNTISDADGRRNIIYYLYQNDGTTLVASNGTGSFTGLTASTTYKMKTTAETSNPVTLTWTLQTSGLTALATTATPVPPTMGDVPNQTGTVGTAFSLNIASSVTLTNSDPILSYAIASGTLPAGLTLNTTTGVISGTPTTAGTYNITVTATDKDGASNADAIQFVVSAAADITPPTTPTISINSGAIAINTTSASLSLSGSDNVGVTGWYVSESSSVPTLGSFVSGAPSGFTLSGGDATKTLYVWTRDAAGNKSDAGSSTIIQDTVTPSGASWVVGVTAKSTSYIGRQISFSTVGGSGINPSGLSVSSDGGGIISNVSISGNVITFDYVTPNLPGDDISISGTSRAGQAFSASVSTPILN